MKYGHAGKVPGLRIALSITVLSYTATRRARLVGHTLNGHEQQDLPVISADSFEIYCHQHRLGSTESYFEHT